MAILPNLLTDTQCSNGQREVLDGNLLYIVCYLLGFFGQVSKHMAGWGDVLNPHFPLYYIYLSKSMW